jgi:hypothetical protein
MVFVWSNGRREETEETENLKTGLSKGADLEFYWIQAQQELKSKEHFGKVQKVRCFFSGRDKMK